VIAMDVRGVGLKALGNGSLYIYNFLEDDFGGGLPTFPTHAPLCWLFRS